MAGNAKAVIEGKKLEQIVDDKIISIISSTCILKSIMLKSTTYHFGEDENIQIFRQRGIYHYLNTKNNNFFKSISKKIVPDMLIINNKFKKIWIIEVKNQTSSGSVDEKLQTGNYKVYYFKRLFSQVNDYKDYDIEYHYIVSEHFVKSEYKDIREYISNDYYSPNVFFHIGTIPRFI